MAREFILIFLLNYFESSIKILLIPENQFLTFEEMGKKQAQLKQLSVMTSDFNNNFNNDIKPRYYRNFSLMGQNNPQRSY
tara:strand:- start:254 stop:493 length:240 start_codon:yes stop_codon:yes gene_type:complete